MHTQEKPPFVVTGTGRSGTGYTAKLLTALGYPCGHEQVFNPWTKESPNFKSAAGDSSWLAVPWLDRLPAGSVILHQVRHPMDVARSHMGIFFFHDQPVEGHEPYRDFVRSHCSIYDHDDPLDRFIRYWVDWNAWIERVAQERASDLKYMRYKLEELNLETVARIVDLIGGDVDLELIDRTLDAMDRSVNHRPRDMSVDVSQLPSGPVVQQFQDMAARYGYTLDDAPAPRVEQHGMTSKQLADKTIEFYKRADWPNVQLGARRILQAKDANEREQALAWQLLGLIAENNKHIVDAINCLARAVTLQPQVPDLRNKLGELHGRMGRALRKHGRLDEAEKHLKQTIMLAPKDAESMCVLGVVMQEQEKFQEAGRYLSQALKLEPKNSRILLNNGNLLSTLNKQEEAIRYYQTAVSIKPDYVPAMISGAAALMSLERTTSAMKLLQQAIELEPENADAHFNYGNAHIAMHEYAEAVQRFESAITIRPDWPTARANWLRHRAELCDWRDDWETELDRVRRETLQALNEGEATPINPSQAPALALSVDLMRRISVSQANQIKHEAARRHIQLKPHPGRPTDRRLRIGYLSFDFRHHATGHLMRTAFEKHDRERFEVFAYSIGPNDQDDAYREKIKNDAEHFIDLFEQQEETVAKRINDDGIDILIDLMGFARNGMTNLLAWRPAPIQVHYLGYPGSIGGLVDYFITDPICSPRAGDQHPAEFHEALAYLPHTYQISDDRQPVGDRVFTRAECGLPEDGFVFCGFNNSYKIQPGIFDVWMRILNRVPGSVIWMYEKQQEVVTHMRSAAEQQGVSPDRLIFAKVVSKSDHLARHRLAQLSLDTPVCNAHTTTTDALWVDVPMISCIGDRFTDRVAASLITAAGLEDMIVTDLQAYEDLAVTLATDPDRLSAIQSDWADRRTSSRLFDTAARVRQLERAYELMWQRHDQGLSPEDIFVEEGA